MYTTPFPLFTIIPLPPPPLITACCPASPDPPPTSIPPIEPLKTILLSGLADRLTHPWSLGLSLPTSSSLSIPTPSTTITLPPYPVTTLSTTLHESIPSRSFTAHMSKPIKAIVVAVVDPYKTVLATLATLAPVGFDLTPDWGTAPISNPSPFAGCVS